MLAWEVGCCCVLSVPRERIGRDIVLMYCRFQATSENFQELKLNSG
jgi:hypothetical protein